MISPYIGTFRVSQPFVLGTHNGIDLVGVDSKDLLSICRGYIGTSTMITDKSNKTWEWGNYVKLVADKDPDIPDGTLIYYCHLSARSVKKGDRVEKGVKLGVEGNTGYSFGSHCHLEIRNSSNRATAEINTPIITGIKNVRGSYTYSPDGKELSVTQYEELKALIAALDKKLSSLAVNINSLKDGQNKLEGKVAAQGKQYAKLSEVPEWARDVVGDIVREGLLVGDGKGDLMLTDDFIRMLYFLRKRGII